MNIEEIDKWLKEEEGISYTELGKEFNYAVERFNKYAKEVKRLNNIINELEKWLDKEINQLKFEDDYENADTLEIVQETLQELKGVDKE